MRRLAFSGAVVAATLAFAYPALASRIVYRNVPLARALELSEVIVRATAIRTPNQTDAMKRPRFRVRAVLRGTGIDAGDVIHVVRPSAIAWASVARSYRQTGVRRSPLVERLTSAAPAPVVGETYCVMLKPASSHPGWRWASSVENAWLSAPCDELMRQIGRPDDNRDGSRDHGRDS